MKLEVRPIINVGIERQGQFMVLPFYHVKITDNAETKTMLVNYTFGEVISAEGMNEPVLKYESEAGELKEQMFNSMSDLYCEGTGKTTVIYLEGNTTQSIKQQIVGLLQINPGGARLLMVWNRAKVDDRPFFEALALLKHKPKPIPFSQLGKGIKEPFTEIPMDTMAKAEILVRMPK